MESDGKIIGQNVFVKSWIKLDKKCVDKLKNASAFFLTLSDGTEAASVLTQGPICIANEYKRKGYGKILLDYSLEKAKLPGQLA